jgi:hypothetical protein
MPLPNVSSQESNTMTRNQRLFLVGAFAGSSLDMIHVVSDVLYYPKPFYFWGQAWWVPFLFGMAAIVLVAGYNMVSSFIGARDPSPPASALTESAIGFILAYLATGFFHHSELLLALGLVLAWSWHNKRHPGEGAVPYALAVAVGGTLFEAILSSTGAFYYREPDVLGVPIWLPALYLHASLLTRAIALRYFRA